jgi:anthranilate/para-aminobenzoate synthase component I
MFIGKIWMMILEFYDEHKTFQGLSIKKTIEAIRAEIAEKLPSDEFSVRAYDDCLREAWGPAGTSVADKIADEMIAALDEANYQAAMREAYQAFKKGEISQFSTSRKTEEDILRDYVELIVDQLIENDL